MNSEIQLLQFLICKEFREEGQDAYFAELVRSNLYVPEFPFYLTDLHAVTCWQKDERFHKEVIEYATDYGEAIKSPHMDIEPAKGSVIFRWHAHQFPTDFAIDRPTVLTIRVILDWEVKFESQLMIEKRPV